MRPASKDPSRGRIAILHFTSSPAIGGVESLIDLQCDALLEAGLSVRLIVGAGEARAGVELVRIPELMPAYDEVVTAAASLDQSLPPTGHPLVRRIGDLLRQALQGCRQCWIQNALTVYLNPFLTVALIEAARTAGEVRWVVWCHDLSDISAYWEGPRRHAWRPADVPNAVFITISEARRRELAALLALPEGAIDVIRPPIDAEQWLGIDAAGRRIVRETDLTRREPVVLVPLKLAPHKGLDVAVGLAACLRARTDRPLLLLTGVPSSHEPGASHTVDRRLRRLARDLGASESFCLVSDLLNGELDWRTVRDLMLVADLVFLPSREEGYGLPLREAAALRVPVLCSDIPPFREAGGEAARYFPLDAGTDAIASQVLEIAQSPANAARRAASRSQSVFREQIQRLACGGSEIADDRSLLLEKPFPHLSRSSERHDT